MGDRRDQGPSLRWSPEWDAGPVWCGRAPPVGTGARNHQGRALGPALDGAAEWGYLAFVPNIAVTGAKEPVMVIW